MPGKLVQKTWQFDPTLNAPARYRRACRYQAFVPDELSTVDLQLDVRTAGIVAEAEQAILSLNAEDAALAPLARLLLRTESIASSRIEGLKLGARDLARVEVQTEVGGRPRQTASEILANIDAMTVAVDEAAGSPVFGIEEIRAIHWALMKDGDNPGSAGIVRTKQNWIGGNDYNPCDAEFVPPPPEDVGRLLLDLCAAIDDRALPPLVQAALVHAQFESIHPFMDGNGRVGRALVHVILKKRRVAPTFVMPLSVVFAGARDRYIAGLTGFRGTETSGWIEQFAVAMWEATRLATAYVASVRELQSRWREQLTQSGHAPRADGAAWTLIDHLPGHPIISAPIAAAVTGRTKPAIYSAIEQLVSAGVLEPLSDQRRNRAWEATGMLALIEGMDSGRRAPAIKL